MNRTEHIQAARDRAFLSLHAANYGTCEEEEIDPWNSASERTIEEVQNRLKSLERLIYFDSLFQTIVKLSISINRIGELEGYEGHVSPSGAGSFYITHRKGVNKILEMAPPLLLIARDGWRRDGDPDLPKGSSTRILYHFKHPSWEDARLCLFSHLITDKEDPSACQLIQVGVKEVPEYKLVCPDGALEENPFTSYNIDDAVQFTNREE